MKKVFKRIGIISAIALGSVIFLADLLIGGINIAKFAIYPDYYEIKTDLCKNPGLSDGFVCQGICAYEDGGKIFVSGYMKDDGPSRIYVTDKDDNSYYVSIYYGSGKEFTGHSGGIAICGDNTYISSGDKIYCIPIASILNAKNGDSVRLSKIIPVNNEASFIYSDDSYIYVGEYHDGGKYVTNHPYDTAEGKHYAIVSRYTRTEIENYKKNMPAPSPDRIYSIRNNVQGICFTPDGKVVMSTSYGIADSFYYIYNESEAVDSGLTFDGAPVYYLDDLEKEIKGPAMSEGLDLHEGKIITLSECASDKYIFGKFFFANKIVALDINKAK